jgi:ketosteroid isomerase-like protein
MTDDEATSATEEILRALLSALNRQDLDAVMSFFAEDCVFETPRGRRPWGRLLVGSSI